MKYLKYFAGSLIISFGILLVVAVVVAAGEIKMPDNTGDYLLYIWIGIAIVIMPFAKKIIRVE
ncbi:MAG: hypothetical protein HKN88_03455 [Gammaproteobacteria bacterium]|nr:hypothetical protein [Gammaproteobacteria bacterium]NNC97110.1 hypothetical protein [Gammaproteobacteria bacterium]NNM14122.1 hypothetical protein [Gammaproteobacteria bacterium]